MSTDLRFCTTSGAAELSTSAVDGLRQLVFRTALGLAETGSRESLERWQPLLSEDCELLDADRDAFQAFFAPCWIGGAAFGFQLEWRGWELDTFELSLNTALALGGDPLRLAARVAGLGREQLWVDSADRPWLAETIARGLQIRLFSDSDSEGEGWAKVHALLASGGSGTVVIGRERSSGAREQLSSASLACHYFGDGLSVLDLMDPDRTARLDRHFGFDPHAEPLPRRNRGVAR